MILRALCLEAVVQQHTLVGLDGETVKGVEERGTICTSTATNFDAHKLGLSKADAEKEKCCPEQHFPRTDGLDSSQQANQEEHEAVS